METTIGLIISLLVNLFLISLLMKKKKAEQENNITEEGIRQMVDAGGDMGSIDETEKEMINNIFDLSNISVGEIATHRPDVACCNPAGRDAGGYHERHNGRKIFPYRGV